MVVRSLIRPRTYRDSVELMSLSTEIRSMPGVRQAVAIMGTDRNKTVLESSGLLVSEAASARPDDLVVVVEGDDAAAVQAAFERIEAALAREAPRAGGPAARRAPRSLGAARRLHPDAQVALISVPGPYAYAEAAKALRMGLHVQIFSDNVSLDDEIRLKRLGRERGLLVMGPDCGTSIIGGVPLGFANAVSRGPIGIVGAAGSGIQELTVLIDRLGSGITHAIGTGGHDLLDAVGAITALMAFDALEHDPKTEVIVLVSKPPEPRSAAMLLERARTSTKPVVVDFLGARPGEYAQAGVIGASTLEEAAARAVALARGQPPQGAARAFPGVDLSPLTDQEVARKGPGQRFVRGLYAGGTLAYEAMYVMEQHLGGVFSNTPLRPEFRLASARKSQGHTVIDLGDDEFTRGRPHPMIDPSYRAERLVAEASDPEVAVILCDVVLGYGAHPDPAGALAGAVRRARSSSHGHLTVVASVCGTRADPQDSERQEETLRREGILVFPSNASAAEAAAILAARCAKRGAER